MEEIYGVLKVEQINDYTLQIMYAINHNDFELAHSAHVEETCVYVYMLYVLIKLVSQ